MSASPFRTTAEPFLEIPVPARKEKERESKELEDIPFESSAKNASASPAFDAQASTAENQKKGVFKRLFSARRARRQREELLVNELQNLRVSYAGLLKTTEKIREHIDHENEGRRSVEKALSPFPDAVAGIAKIQTRQEEAGETLASIREELTSTAERDEEVMTKLGFLSNGVETICESVGKVDERIGEVVEYQAATTASLGTLGTDMESHFEEVKTTTRKSGERIEQSNGDVLSALRKVEASSQRALWIFSSLLAAIVVALIVFAAQVGQLGETSQVPVAPAVEPAAIGSSDTATPEAVAAPESDDAIVLSDELDF
jgi:chromosome segregation ATPase